MDYKGGAELWKYQWDLVHDPETILLGFMQDEREGAAVDANAFVASIVENGTAWTGQITCITPAGKPYTLPQNVNQLMFVNNVAYSPQGALVGFKLTTGENYAATYWTGKKEFAGYAKVVDSKAATNLAKVENDGKQPKPLVDIATGNLPDETPVYLGYAQNCEIELCTVALKEVKDRIATANYTGVGECEPTLHFANATVLPQRLKDDAACLNKHAKAFYDAHLQQAGADRVVLLRIARLLQSIESGGDKVFDDYLDYCAKSRSNAYYGSLSHWGTSADLLLFEEALAAYIEGLNALEAKITAIKVDSDSEYGKLADLSWLLANRYPTSATTNARLHVLDALSRRAMRDDAVWGNVAEQTALRLINGTPESQYKSLIDGLKENKLVNRLAYRIDGGNFKHFAIKVSDCLLKAYPPPSVEQLHQNTFANRSNGQTESKVFIWNKRFLDDYVIYHSLNRPDAATLKITYEMRGDLGTRFENYLTDLDPLEYVGLDLRSDLKYLGVSANADNSVAVVPALIFHWVLNEQDNEARQRAILTAVDAGLTIFTLGEYAVAKTVAAKAFAIANIAMPSIDIMVNLSGLRDDPAYNDFVEVWNIAYASYAGVTSARLAFQLMPEKVQNFCSFWKQNRLRMGCPASKIDEVDNAVAQIDDIVNGKNGYISGGLAKGAVKVSDQIDNTLARLTGKAKYSLNNTGEYRLVGGHHPVAKIAFEGDLAYDYQKAFSVKTLALDDAWKSANSGIPQNLHAKVTGQQNSLYTAWKNANPNTKLTIDVMADIEIQAMKNVGIPEDIATGWVVKALEDLKTQGVNEIKNIPWNGVN